MSQAINAIHQFHHGVDIGDGVTGSLLFIRKLLRGMGYQSEIFAAHIPKALADEARPYHQLKACDDGATVLLQHHSLGHDLGDWLATLSMPRALVYHNITPPGFFSPGSDVRHYAELGRKQLTQWRDDFKAVLAVSDYNAADLVALGYDRERIAVIPLLVDLDKIEAGPEERVDIAERLHPELAHRPALLFVGRIVENKRQHLLLEALWYLHRMRERYSRGPRPMLILVGGGKSTDYGRFLRQRLHQLHLDDSVILADKVDDTMLRALYRQSAAFVCASAHEGFGMPLVEAMMAGCPVVAMGLTNIPSTLGEGGLILDSEHPAALAATLSLLLDDAALREQVLAGQQRSLVRYQPSVLADALARWLAEAFDTASSIPAH